MAAVRPYEYARELILRFGLDSVPVDVEAVARRLGIAVNYFDNPNKTDPEYHKTLVTACAWLDKSKNAMWVYSGMPVTRQRLSIAHEIMHFVNPYHACISPFSGNDTSPYFNPKPQERQAYEGALWLLFLCDKFADRIRHEHPSIDLITQLAHEHGVSQEATAMWYVRANTRPCALVVAEPVKGITHEQEETMFSISESGEPVPQKVVLTNGEQIELKPHALQVRYAVFSSEVSKKPFAKGRGIPLDSPICYAYRSGELYQGEISGLDMGLGRTTEHYECESVRFGVPGEYKVMTLAWLDPDQPEMFQ
jgi:Zn-dependent peptidase ImmA (M78 family)